MADIRIQIEKLWVDDFYPWQASEPWNTTGTEVDIINFSPLYWEDATDTWDDYLVDWDSFTDLQPTIKLGWTILPDTQVLTLTNPDVTIIAGVAVIVDADTQILNLTTKVPTIKYSWTIFPDTETITLTQLEIRRAGNPWEERSIPGTCGQWTDRTSIDSDWEERDQVLWSPFIYPWQLALPWQTQSSIETSDWTDRTIPDTITWDEATMTWDNATFDWDNYTINTKPTTTWQI